MISNLSKRFAVTGRLKNGLHWVRDVTFNEDQSRVGDRTAAIGWAILRKIALNLLKGNTEMRTSIRGRCKRAGWDDAYMEQLLHNNLMRYPWADRAVVRY